MSSVISSPAVSSSSPVFDALQTPSHLFLTAHNLHATPLARFKAQERIRLLLENKKSRQTFHKHAMQLEINQLKKDIQNEEKAMTRYRLLIEELEKKKQTKVKAIQIKQEWIQHFDQNVNTLIAHSILDHISCH